MRSVGKLDKQNENLFTIKSCDNRKCPKSLNLSDSLKLTLLQTYFEGEMFSLEWYVIIILEFLILVTAA